MEDTRQNLTWFVVYTNIRCEERAMMGLRQKGFDVCLPVLTKWHRRPKQKHLNAEKLGQEAIELAKAQGVDDPFRLHKVYLKAAGKLEYPLFVRYLFVGVDTARQQLYPIQIRATDGVERVLQIDGMWRAIAPGVISALRLAMVSGAFDQTLKTERERKASEFAPGQNVRVAEGPFEGFIGKVKAADSDRRVEILLEVFKRETTVVLEDLQLKCA